MMQIPVERGVCWNNKTQSHWVGLSNIYANYYNHDHSVQMLWQVPKPSFLLSRLIV